MITTAPALLLVPWLAVSALTAVAAADPLDDELARYNEASGRIDKTFQEGLARERAHSLNALIAIARHETGAADLAGKAWTQVLLLDAANDEARKFFTAMGKLDAVLAEVASHHGLLIGKGETTPAKPALDPRLDMGGAKTVRILAQYGQGYAIGNHRTGTVILIQYVSGTWAATTNGKLENPDAAATDADLRVELIEDSGNTPTSLAVIPAGTVDTPFQYTLERDVVGMTLRIKSQRAVNARRGTTTYQGEVVYKVKIIQ
jgi:hypothetical protein